MPAQQPAAAWSTYQQQCPAASWSASQSTQQRDAHRDHREAEDPSPMHRHAPHCEEADSRMTALQSSFYSTPVSAT